VSRLAQWPNRIRESLWFVPMLIVLGAVALAGIMIFIDSRVSRDLLQQWPLLFGAGAEGERAMLSAIATSMITVAGVTFSITMVAVAQSANQYTSRVLGNFMRDRPNQTVLGVFVGVFAYCLVVIRTIHDDGEDMTFVPSLSVLVAFLLALMAMGFLIYFIHHIAQSLQSSTLVSRVREDTVRAVDRLFPDDLGDEADASELRRDAQPGIDRLSVESDRTGYIQSVQNDALIGVADELGAVLRMERGIGEFVVEGELLVTLQGRDTLPDDQRDTLLRAYDITQSRTVEQDAAYGVRQMVDVALKALSPASNNTTTAIRCVDHLSAVLCRVASRRIESRVRAGEHGPAVIARGPTFRSLVDTAFDEIRRSAAGNISVLERLLASIERIAGFCSAPGRREVLREHVDRIAEIADRTIPSAADREHVVDRCNAVRRRLETGGTRYS
jgi:uncharacterized membrane protein